MFCQRTKEYLSQKQIPFRERDVTSDADAVAELQRLGYVTTPITVMDGIVIVGFDATKIDAALSSA
ncbi:MAG TPA: glutaredoxin family protein [Terriglobales bacterium]|nr:glutaredoxin family protein [Terriglobales bacterium]